jgi:ribonuclease P protein component
MNATFPKSEKLCGKIAIESLYKKGKRFVAWPLRITYMPSTSQSNQVLVWAPKSLFKHAFDRNRLRRQMREAYRLNKHLLADSKDGFQIAINYMDRQQCSYAMMERAMRKALIRIANN